MEGVRRHGSQVFLFAILAACIFFSVQALRADEVPCFWDEHECISGSCESNGGTCIDVAGDDCFCFVG